MSQKVGGKLINSNYKWKDQPTAEVGLGWTFEPQGFCWNDNLNPFPATRLSVTTRAKNGPLLVSFFQIN